LRFDFIGSPIVSDCVGLGKTLYMIAIRACDLQEEGRNQNLKPGL
jgi:hypothetical protein